MNATIVVALIGAASGLGALVLGILNIVAGRGGRRADEAGSLTKTGIDLLHEVEKKCDKCEISLQHMRTDFGEFADKMETYFANPDPDPEARRMALVAIRAARLASFNPN